MMFENWFSPNRKETAPVVPEAKPEQSHEQEEGRRFPADFDRDMLFERLVPTSPFDRMKMAHAVMLPETEQQVIKDIFDHEANDSAPGSLLRLKGHDFIDELPSTENMDNTGRGLPEEAVISKLRAEGSVAASPDAFLYLVSEFAHGNDCEPLVFEDHMHNVMYSEAAKSFIEAYADDAGNVVIRAWRKGEAGPHEAGGERKVRFITYE